MAVLVPEETRGRLQRTRPKPTPKPIQRGETPRAIRGRPTLVPEEQTLGRIQPATGGPKPPPTQPAPSLGGGFGGGGGGGGFPQEAERLQQLSLEGIGAERKAIEEDLARQLSQIGELQRFREQEVGTRVGQLETDRPEQVGRLGSQFAARGSFSSGARQEAQSDLVEDISRQIEGMKANLLEGQKRAEFQRQELQVAAQRGLEDLKRAEEAQTLQFALAKKGGRGGGGGAVDPDRYRSEATSYLTARTNQLRAQGRSLKDAEAQAFQEARQRYPGLDETWLYRFLEPESTKFSEFGGQVIGANRGNAISVGKQQQLRRKPLYQDANAEAREFLRRNPNGTDQQFLNWAAANIKRDGGDPNAIIGGNPMLWSVAIADARR